ncbi:hypothetical protein NUH88_21520 [Nisaea acidiphila]|uniref:Uncharacterized protein n=1 Tax=Nisaea acidiphila TaxID=1862145 RepID=A0A9J7AQS3_9PROT|nr:hypothetical protein [Nisaea acidiphila]UUX49955.1 hypothetical protein NUH88_21520 [Nisaea acidiphila]
MNTISSAVSGALPPPPPPGGAGGPGKALSEEEKSTIASILEQYDPESLSEEDVDSIKQQLQDAGIDPSPELGSLIEEAGFDKEQFRPDGPPPGGPPPGGEGGPSGLVSEDGLKTLSSILEEYDVENLSEDDVSAIQQQLAEAGFFGQGSVVDLGA